MTDTVSEFARVQRWMQSVVMHPDGIDAGVNSPAAREQIAVDATALEQVIRRSRSQTSSERLRIYGNAYFARLLECLRTEFPAVVHALGEQTFDPFAFEYLQSYPSRSDTLGNLGAHFAQHLADTRPAPEEAGTPDYADFLIDLARLERAYTEIFDLPGPEHGEHLSPQELQAIPPEGFHEVHLIPFPCVRLMSFAFPVHKYASAVRHDASNVSVPSAEPTRLVLTRRDFVVRNLPVSATQFALLGMLLSGHSLGQAIAETCPAETEDVAAELFSAFRSWTAAPLFLGLRRDSTR